MSTYTNDSGSTHPVEQSIGWDLWTVATLIAGILLASIHALHVYEMLYYGFIGVFVEGVIPFILAGLIAGVGPWLSYAGYSRPERRRVIGWMALTGVLIGLLFLWALSHQELMGYPFPHAEFVTTTNVTAGAFLGVFIGLYDVRARRHQAGLRAEREMVELQRSRLSVLNRILRHNIRNDATVIRGVCENISEETSGSVAEQAQLAATTITDLYEMSERARRFDRVIDPEISVNQEIELAVFLEELLDHHRDEHGSVTFHAEVVDDIQTIQSNPELLKEVLLELIDSTLSHGGDSLRQITVTATSMDDDQLKITVDGDGDEIPTSEWAALEAGEETDLEHASGVGLWFVKWGLQMLNGDLQVQQGTTTETTISARIPANGR